MSLFSRFNSPWIWRTSSCCCSGRLGVGQRLGGRARGGERVLQLVGDILGETLARLDAPIERRRHLAECRGHLADLVGAMGELGQLVAGFDVAADVLGHLRKPAHGTGDGAGEQERGEQRRREGRERQRDDDVALLRQHLVDLAGPRRQQQHALHRLAVLDRYRQRHDLLALLVDEQHGRCGTAQGHPHLGVDGAVGRADLAIDRQIAPHQPRQELGPGALDLDAIRRLGGLGTRAPARARGAERCRRSACRRGRRRVPAYRSPAPAGAGSALRARARSTAGAPRSRRRGRGYWRRRSPAAGRGRGRCDRFPRMRWRRWRRR